MEWAVGGFAGAMAILAIFSGVALLIWVVNKAEAQKTEREHEKAKREQELAHAERMKALERGLPLPDAQIAQARAERIRARWGGIVAVAVPLGSMAMALAFTAIVMGAGEAWMVIPSAAIAWGIA